MLFSHFCNDRQGREGDITGTGEDGQEIGDDGGQNSDVFWIFTQQFFGLLHQIVHPASDLHSGDSGDNRHND
ncbi:hypothetical protein D3C78_1919510 [compost metagenome]